MPQAYTFADFRFEPSDLRLVYQTRVIPLTARAADTLLVLVQHPDSVVTKEALMAAVWPGIVVEENNLNQQISTLRKALCQNGGPELIETVPRRGYRFLGPVRAVDSATIDSPTATRPPDSARPRTVVRWLSLTAASIALAAAVAVSWQASQGWRATRASEAARKRGEDLMRQNNARAAAAELQEAIRLDPKNARAYGVLAHALGNLGSEGSTSAYRPAGQSPSVAAAERSVSLDPRCGECQGTLGMFLFYHDWQWARAEERYREALRLAPESEGIRASHAMLLAATGQNARALEEIESALRKRPYQLTWMGIRTSILYFGRRYTEAIAAADQTLAMSNKDRAAWEWRSKALFQLGRGPEAVNALAQDLFADRTADLDRAVRDDGTEGGLRMLLAITNDWRGRVEYSWRRGPWRALLNDSEGALDEVERVYQARRLNAIYLGVDPVYDRIRDHPRFQKVLTGMGLSAVLER
jgi:DNA-binding winged helix-turn-helix (wHTH) protein/Tfp pilus assembly protein PilF